MTSLFNKGLLDSIYSALADSEFGLESFDVTFPNTNQILLKAVFLPDPQYKLTIKDNGGLPRTVASYEAPGEHLNEEVYGGTPLSNIPERLEFWTMNLSRELRSAGAPPDNIREITEQLEELITENVVEPEKRFSSEEIEQLKERLANLEHRFAELESAGIISGVENSQLNGEIKQASKDLSVLTKGIWYRISLTKILRALKGVLTSKEAREIMKEAAKKLIGLD
ncbi:MAG: hypothetical protein AB2810_15905 [Candidatus Thiodiazotropha endolucinida]